MIGFLEGNIVVHWWYSTALAIIAASRVFGGHPCSAATTQKSYPLSDNLSHVTFVTTLIVIVSSSNTAFDEDLSTLGQILPASLPLFAPNNDIVPFGSLLPIALSVRPDLRCGNWKPRHGTTCGSETHLRIFAQITN